MIALNHLIALAICCSSPAIAVIAGGFPFWLNAPSTSTDPAKASSQSAAVALATQVPIPTGWPALSPSWNLARPNPDGSLTPPIVYTITGTTKIIGFTNINAPLDGATTLMCLLQASADSFAKVVAMRRDGFIENGRFTSQFQQNGSADYATINVRDQTETGNHVTYGTLEAVLRGLGQFMTAQNSFFETAFFITDGSWGRVGYGSIVGNRAYVRASS